MIFTQALTRCVSYCFLHAQTITNGGNYTTAVTVVLPIFADENGIALKLNISEVDVYLTNANSPSTSNTIVTLTHNNSGMDAWFGYRSSSTMFTFVSKIEVYVDDDPTPRYESFSNPCAVLGTNSLGDSDRKVYLPVQLIPVVSLKDLQ